MTNILLVEDDKEIVKNLSLFLQEEGFRVRAVSGQKDALEQIEEHGQEIDLVLLDVSLQDGNGFAVCAAVKANTEIPVIFLTALGSTENKVKGLRLGADDYLPKPFEIVELLARVEAVLRRFNKTGTRLKVFDVEIDTASRSVSRAGEEIALTMKEFDLLLLLARNRNIALYRETIYETVWGGEYMGQSRTVDLHIQRLKKKLGWDKEITAVYKVGYRLEEE